MKHPPHTEDAAGKPLNGVVNLRTRSLPGIEKFCGPAWHPCYSMHALRSALADRHGAFTPPASLRIVNADIVEAEYVAGKVVKVIARIPLNEKLDMVFALVDPLRDGGLRGDLVTVKTVWLNEKTDTHTDEDMGRIRCLRQQGKLVKKNVGQVTRDGVVYSV
jgi:hypothetical protein